jgi:hypothetical protein
MGDVNQGRTLVVAVAALMLSLAIAPPAHADHELGKARAKIIAGSIISFLGVAAFATGIGFAATMSSNQCECGESVAFIVVPLLTVGAAHIAIGAPVLGVGVYDLGHLPPAPRPLADPNASAATLGLGVRF